MGEPTDESSEGDKGRSAARTERAGAGADRAPEDLVETVGEVIDKVREKLQGH